MTVEDRTEAEALISEKMKFSLKRWYGTVCGALFPTVRAYLDFKYTAGSVGFCLAQSK